MTQKLEERCKHEVLEFIDFWKDLNIEIENCYSCNSTRAITNKYEHYMNGRYELKEEVKE